MIQSILQLTVCLAAASGSSIHGEDIRQKLSQFANDGLGVQQFQSYLDTEVTYTFTPLEGSQLAQELSESMAEKLKVRVDALEQMAEDIIEAYDVGTTATNHFEDCCDIELNLESSILNTNINEETLCTTGQGTKQGATEYLPFSINEKIKAQYETALGIKYAYFGSEEGVMFNYPAIRTCDKQYDPRFRPWYVEAATSLPKDLVIIIDKSGSMSEEYQGQELIAIAKDAANTVISTLNPNDRVGVVTFATDANAFSGKDNTTTCYATELALATAQNKANLKSYLANIDAYGETHYLKAFEYAFTFFHNTPKSARYDARERERVILFLSDGKPTDATKREIIDKIAYLNDELDNSVMIFTYGIKSAPAGILKDIAQQEIPGIFTMVKDLTNLRKVMASYYDRFKDTDVAQVSFTVPFLDAFGSGLTEAMCLPVIYNDKLKGVACLELSVDDMLSDITYFRQGKNSYAFIIDKNARLLTHPSLPLPEDVTNEPYFLYLDAVETFTGADAMLDSMLSHKNGNVSVDTSHVISRGDVQLEGVDIRQQRQTYSWSSIKGTDFSLCLVIPDGDYISKMVWNEPFSNFLYHRLDLTISPRQLCKLFTRIVTKDKSAVFLAARAFYDPFQHLHIEETINDVLRYPNSSAHNDTYNNGLTEDIIETIAMTSIFDDMIASSSQYEMNCVWRYVGMENGVHRIYPGSEIPKNYDPVRRTWYLRAKANTGKVVVSAPYEDAFGAGTVVTLSQVLFERQNGDHTRHITGVMGMDFTVPYFYYLAAEGIGDCDTNSCFLMDDSGFIIVHKDWFTGHQKSSQITDVHITVYETGIAQTLIQYDILQAQTCVNVETLKDQYFWRLQLSDKFDGSLMHPRFDLFEVPDTNMFLVVVKQPFIGCNCHNVSRYEVQWCPDFTQYTCFFPCYSWSDAYQHCKNHFGFSGHNNIPCNPPSPAVNFLHLKEQERLMEEIKHAGECYDYNCMDTSTKSTPSQCNSVVSCSWCLYNASANPLDTPYCSTQSECPLKQRFSEDDFFCNEDFSAWKIAVLCLAVFPLIPIWTLCCYHLKSGKEECFSLVGTACGVMPFMTIVIIVIVVSFVDAWTT